MLYTPGTEALYDHGAEGVKARINHLVDVTNKAFADSGVKITINPVSTERLETTSDEDDINFVLTDLMGERSSDFEGLHNKRYVLGADVMVMFRPLMAQDSAKECGVSVPNYLKRLTHFARRNMVSIVNINCSDLALVHHLGHNLGLHHYRGEPDPLRTYEFGAGYAVKDKFTTIMASGDLSGGLDVWFSPTGCTVFQSTVEMSGSCLWC